MQSSTIVVLVAALACANAG
ncbi:unnamed protein product, partial [Allacma fusca]